MPLNEEMSAESDGRTSMAELQVPDNFLVNTKCPPVCTPFQVHVSKIFILLSNQWSVLNYQNMLYCSLYILVHLQLLRSR
jgi:hypothetical protein